MNDDDSIQYKVVVNHEEQYSIWPAHRDNALGWRDAGKVGQKAECLAYIKEVWIDMRPLSVRGKLSEPPGQASGNPAQDEDPDSGISNGRRK